jgi:hypothetical protein
MISPVRPSSGNPKAEKYPIACGALGGFSGFLHESFRRHDYLLGRRNAQAFLRWNFALPETNILFTNFTSRHDRWYVRNADGVTGSINEEIEQALPRKKFAITVGGQKDADGFPIIPLVGKLRHPIEIGPEDMPRPEPVSRNDLYARIQARARTVVNTLIDIDLHSDTDKLGIIGGAVRIGAKTFGPKLVTQRAIDSVDAALEDIAEAFGQRQS